MPPNSSKAFKILQTTLRSLNDRIYKPISFNSCTISYAMKEKGSGLLYLITWIMLAFLSRLEELGKMGKQAAERAGTCCRLCYTCYNARIDRFS
jgi:hypothetical protein